MLPFQQIGLMGTIGTAAVEWAYIPSLIWSILSRYISLIPAAWAFANYKSRFVQFKTALPVRPHERPLMRWSFGISTAMTDMLDNL